MRHAILLLSIAALLFSCGKYEDGPGISLKSKAKRLAGEWEVISIADTALTDFKLKLEIEEDGDASFTPVINVGFFVVDQFSVGGEWEWTYKKEGIQIILNMDAVADLLELAGDFDVSSIGIIKEIYEYEILRLTDKELWVKDESDDIWKLEKID